MPCLGILGTFVWDRIHPMPGAAGDVVEDWGGIVYSLAAFEAAREDGWSFLPIAKVGADLYDDAVSRVANLDGVRRLDGLLCVPEPTNRVDLHYHDQGDRCEHLVGGVPGWTWSELEPLLAECDAVYVNFIAGWELDLPAARAMRRGFPGSVYCDIHSLLLGVDDAGIRVRRALPDWSEWAACFDWIQGNEAEIGIVSGTSEPAAAVRRLVEDGAEAAFATLGPSGAAWAASDGTFGIERPPAPLEPPPAPLEPTSPAVAPASPAIERGRSAFDPTGCGDVWGAACVAALVAGRAVPAAVRGANHLAAGAAARRGTTGLARALERLTPAERPAR